MSLKFKSQYKMDKGLETNGKWVAWGDGAELLVARANNPEATKLREELEKPFARPGFRKRKITDDDQKAITRRVLAYACLKDWKGVSVEGLEGMLLDKYKINVDDPKNAAYTPELGLAMLTEFEDFLTDVLLVCTNEDLYREQDVEEDAGK